MQAVIEVHTCVDEANAMQMTMKLYGMLERQSCISYARLRSKYEQTSYN